ncbi:LamG domain-containing protein [Streptomyces sp. NPDC058953]|uniref:LamG domain-containing protein n=1 Tax=unclassified Streptomyces TaxID=2593676 RepID=UPI00367CB512
MSRGVLVAVVTASAVAGGLAVLPKEPNRADRARPAATTTRSALTALQEEQAQATARRTGQQVEVLRLRGERTETFAEPDGAFTTRHYTEPVNAVRDGRWVDVDTTLQRAADGIWRPKAATVDLELSSGDADKPFVSMERTGRVMSVTWPYGRLPTPVVQGDTATYPDALPGVDLRVQAEADGFGHLLVVKTPEAAADPRLARINFGLDTRGLRFAKSASGALKAEDSAAGGTVFEAGKPVMWDSASVREPAPAARVSGRAGSAARTAHVLESPGGGGRSTEVGLELGNGTMTLVPDQTLLRGAGTVFPVVIDPITKTSHRTAWTGVMSGMPTEQDWKYTDSAGVGQCPTDYNPVSCNGVDVRRLLFTMPVSSYQGKQILGATFSARVAHIYSATPRAEPIRLYRVGGRNYSVTSSSNWSNTRDDWVDHVETVDKAISPTSCSSQANLHFESGPTGGLTGQVRKAADEGWSSMTLGLRAADESRFAEWKRICGNAYLSVRYNTLPRQIKTDDMSTDRGACVWGAADRLYTEKPPVLQVQAVDPDHGKAQTDKVKVQFKVDWTQGGQPRSYTYDTGYLAPIPGTRFTHTVRKSIPQNTVVYWSARAFDGDGWGPWSYEGSAQRCEFIYDSTLPGAPNVLSKQYPSDTVYHDGVGTTGTFTFAPNPNDSHPDNDVVKYHYAFGNKVSTASPALTPTGAGGAVSVSWTPTRSGRHWVEVLAVDRAGNTGARALHSFLVSEGRPVVSQWNLADEAGSASAHDETGKFSADAGSGITFGVEGPGGRADAAARFDGTSGGYLDSGETVLGSDKSFSVSAWVRPTDLTRDAVVVSQDGTGEPGFTLGYDAVAATWAFSLPVADVDALGDWQAVATGVAPVKDQWVLLTGVYDAQTSDVRLYVNKDLKGSAKRDSVWRSYGSLQIGRATAKSGYGDHFTGDIAEVRAFDRILPPGEVAELMTLKPERKGYWQLDVSGSASPETGGGQPLNLAGGAQIYRPADPLWDPAALVGDGHLTLDGLDDYAATTVAPVTGAASFTLTARARIAAIDSPKAQTVLSLPGTSANRLVVRYRPPSGTEPSKWELAVADSDAATATVKTFADDVELPDTGGSGQHLAAVYDAVANEVRLYVNGQLASSAHGVDNTLWPAKGGLQVGRSALGGGSEYFAGALDEIRAYNGAADPVAIRQMSGLTALPHM